MSEKTRAEQLAIFGGTPAFSEADSLHVGRPNVGDTKRLLDRIAGAIEQRRLTNDGPFVRDFGALRVPVVTLTCLSRY